MILPCLYQSWSEQGRGNPWLMLSVGEEREEEEREEEERGEDEEDRGMLLHTSEVSLTDRKRVISSAPISRRSVVGVRGE